MLREDVVQQTPATPGDVPVRGPEVTGVVRIRYLPSAGVVHQQAYLAGRIGRSGPMQVLQIPGVHPHYVVVVYVIRPDQSSAAFPLAGYPVNPQLGSRTRIHGVADVLAAGPCGCDLELPSESLLVEQSPEHELRHWAAADVAVADEQNSYAPHRPGGTRPRLTTLSKYVIYHERVPEAWIRKSPHRTGSSTRSPRSRSSSSRSWESSWPSSSEGPYEKLNRLGGGDPSRLHSEACWFFLC